MKILIIHNHYQQKGGESIAVENQIELLRNMGHKVVKYEYHNREMNNYNVMDKLYAFIRFFFNGKTRDEIKRVVKKEKPQIAHVHNVFPLISPGIYNALNDAKIPIFQSIHNFRFLCPNGLFFTNGNICERCKFGNTIYAIKFKCVKESLLLSTLYALNIWLHRSIGTFRKIQCYIAPSEFTARKLAESGVTHREKIAVLGHFASSLNAGVVKRKNVPGYMLYVGRLSPEKGVVLLIKAATDSLGVGIKIIGDGPQYSKLVKLTRKLNATHIEFLGRVEGKDKIKYLENAMATIVPSVCYETFGLTALESLSVGTPVIAANTGSLPFIVNDGKNGLLFESGNYMDLRDKIKKLVKEKNLAYEMGLCGINTVKKKYNPNKYYNKLMAIYDSVLT